MLKTIIIAFCFSLALEIFQLFTFLGAGSTKDLITNTFGAFIGSIIYKYIYYRNKIKLLNVCSLVIIIITIPLLLYALVNTINNIDIYFKILMRTL